MGLPSGTSIYITGRPCFNCLQRIINFGITNIYAAGRKGSITDDERAMELKQRTFGMSSIEYEEVDIENSWIKKVFLYT
jgi:deoxycytidylate deaminase